MKHLIRPEILRLLAIARAISERDWLMILIAYHHGLRSSEVVGLKGSSITGEFLTVQRVKGSRRTVQPLLSNDDPRLDEKSALMKWAANRTGQERLFPITRRQFARRMQKYCAMAGIPRHLAHPHVLKHSIAHQIIGSVGIMNTKQWMGHKSMASTGIYLEVSDQEAGAAVELAMVGIHPSKPEP